MENGPMRTTSIPSLIAWLSLCLLAAAFGHALDTQWQIIWAEIGAFGLAAAVGLGSLEKTRAAATERVYNRVMQTRVECGLARLNEHSAAVDSINTACADWRSTPPSDAAPRSPVRARQAPLANATTRRYPARDRAGRRPG